MIGLGGVQGVDEVGGGGPEGLDLFLAGGVGQGQSDVGLAATREGEGLAA